jgi:hypothetical protein
MLSICVFGTLLHSRDSTLTNYFVISREIGWVLMGIAIAGTTYLIICSPFGRRIRSPFQSRNNGNFSLAEADPPLGCCLLRECAKVFHDRQSPCPFACHFDPLFRESEAAPRVKQDIPAG